MNATTAAAAEIVNTIAQLLIQDGRSLLSQGRIPRDAAAVWQRLADKSILELQAEQCKPHIPHWIKLQLHAKLLHLTTLKGRIEIVSASVIVGAGIQASRRIKWEDVESAFRSRIRTGNIINLGYVSVQDFLKEAKTIFAREIQRNLQQVNALKVNTVLSCEFLKPSVNEVEVKAFNTRNGVIFQTTDLENWFHDSVEAPLLRDLEKFQERDSGWSLHSILHLTININKYNPLRAGSYIELPAVIKKKHACLNVRNLDNACFKWAVLSALHPVDRLHHPDRVSYYVQFENELNFTGLEFPLMPQQVSRFEKLNPTVSVNVYALELHQNVLKVVPIHVAKVKKEHHVNLLLIQPENTYIDLESNHPLPEDNEGTPIRYHYVYIRNLSRLVRSQITKYMGKIHICDRCLHYFNSPGDLRMHEVDCSVINECRVELPTSHRNGRGERGDILKFKNPHNKERVPFIVYADFECILKPIIDVEANAGAKSRAIQNHEAFSVGYYVYCSHDSALSTHHSYRGVNPAAWFADSLLHLAQRLQELYESPTPLNLTVEEERLFQTSGYCHICEKQSHRLKCAYGIIAILLVVSVELHTKTVI